MASSTITLERTLKVTQQFNWGALLTFTNPSSNDPGFTNADWVRQFILAPPFAWRWNRTNTDTTCVTGASDIVLPLSNFGWLEKAVITDPTDGNRAQELEIVLNLTQETVPNLPMRIAAQDDDGEGNITFRLMPPPDKEYGLTLISQNAPPLFAAATDTWAPIPDYLSYLYNQGMKALAYEYTDDSRYQIAIQIFMQQVVAANNGLTESQRNIFLSDRLNTARENLSVQATARK